jgi:hypothetical protein
MQTAVRIDVVVVYVIQGLAIIFLIGGAAVNKRLARWLNARAVK